MVDLVEIFKKQDELNRKTAAKHEEYSKLSRDELTQLYAFSALCELGEMSNEWGQFKIWKTNRKENRKTLCTKCNGKGEIYGDSCQYCEGGFTNPLREEYIDVVHFVVSVAIGFDLDPEEFMKKFKRKEVTASNTYKLIRVLYKYLVYADVLIDELQNLPNTEKLVKNNQIERLDVAEKLIDKLLHLGYSLGFDDEEIESAYFDKHKVNHIRQQNHY